MSAARFTPGPWRYWTTVNGGRVAGHPADGTKNFVCDVLLPERSVDWETNARLIASAPELLAALDELLFYSDAMKGTDTHRRCVGALAKATGKTS